MDASSLADVGILAARVCLSVVYLWSGVAKLCDRVGGMAEVKALRLPAPSLCLALTILCQIDGGLMVLLGLWTRLGALVLLGFTVVATFIGHPFWRLAGGERVQQRTIALEHLAIVGGFILLVVTGGGAFSLDRWWR
jgi:putative oxidoreductase